MFQVILTTSNPIRELFDRMKEEAPVHPKREDFVGESIARELATLLVDSDEFAGDVAPGFLVNPKTGRGLEPDRYYPTHTVDFEFNGPQHYRPTRPRRLAAHPALVRTRHAGPDSPRSWAFPTSPRSAPACIRDAPRSGHLGNADADILGNGRNSLTNW